MFLNIGEYENYGNLDFIVVNPNNTYKHFFVQEGNIALNESIWESQHILGERKIIFIDWVDYGYSATVWGSHKPWRIRKT